MSGLQFLHIGGLLFDSPRLETFTTTRLLFKVFIAQMDDGQSIYFGNPLCQKLDIGSKGPSDPSKVNCLNLSVHAAVAWESVGLFSKYNMPFPSEHGCVACLHFCIAHVHTSLDAALQLGG